jgi:Ca2+-binding EF-hand superfamily protein
MSLDEWWEGHQVESADMSWEEVEEWFHVWDRNENGYLSRDEFFAMYDYDGEGDPHDDWVEDSDDWNDVDEGENDEAIDWWYKNSDSENEMNFDMWNASIWNEYGDDVT